MNNLWGTIHNLSTSHNMTRINMPVPPQNLVPKRADISDDKIVSLSELGLLLKEYEEWSAELEQDYEKVLESAGETPILHAFLVHLAALVHSAQAALFCSPEMKSSSVPDVSALKAALLSPKPMYFLNVQDLLRVLHDVLLQAHNEVKLDTSGNCRAYNHFVMTLENAIDYKGPALTKINQVALTHSDQLLEEPVPS